MEHLFQGKIKDWASWGSVFTSIPLFQPLIEEIYRREGLSTVRLVEHLTPGTNAVFLVNRETVVKIFVPAESGVDTAIDFENELAGIRRAMAAHVATATVRAAGEMMDRYRFRYLILDYINAPEAGKVLKTFSSGQKRAFVARMKDTLARLDTPLPADTPCSLIAEALENERWLPFAPKLRRELKDYLAVLPPFALCNVHGDLTGDNVLLRDDGTPVIIDFADYKAAPFFYELPPLFFDLFDLDPVLIQAWADHTNIDQLAHDCFHALLLHDFGGDFCGLICKRLLGKQPEELQSLAEIECAVREQILYLC